jgi:hypothetical protein
MNKVMVATGLAVVMLTVPVVAAEPLQPGYKVGEPLQLFVNEYRVTGPKPGEGADLVCSYARRPVVMVYAREISAPVVRLIKKVDEVTGAHQKESLGSYVVLLCDTQDREADLKALAEKEKVQHTLLALVVINETALKKGPEWRTRGLQRLQAKFGAEAETTIVLASEQRVRASYAYRKGELKDKDIDQIFTDLPKILPSAADESRGDDFVRIEVRGKLDKWAFNPLERDQYAVMVERNKGQQPFLLLLPDDATRKAAQDLVGQMVTVTGDGVVGVVVSDGKRKESTMVVTQVTVKSLKKADNPDAPKK